LGRVDAGQLSNGGEIVGRTEQIFHLADEKCHFASPLRILEKKISFNLERLRNNYPIGIENAFLPPSCLRPISCYCKPIFLFFLRPAGRGSFLETSENRIFKDRRKRPTQGLSLYTFFGRRRSIRRKPDQDKGGYVDRYSPTLFFFLILIVGLNILDAFFTMLILDFRGWEVNPVVRSVIDIHGNQFWVWKFAIVSACLVLLCLHSRFKRVKGIIVAISSIYLTVVLYQIFLLVYVLS